MFFFFFASFPSALRLSRTQVYYRRQHWYTQTVSRPYRYRYTSYGTGNIYILGNMQRKTTTQKYNGCGKRAISTENNELLCVPSLAIYDAHLNLQIEHHARLFDKKRANTSWSASTSHKRLPYTPRKERRSPCTDIRAPHILSTPIAHRS
ncbi:unnamed protein product [Ectocarpus sp. 6 AP-2014]